jgi:hypothetical protein
MDSMPELKKKGELEAHLDQEFFRTKNPKLSSEAKISEFKEKIRDENYINHAIQKIATDLTHFLLK